MATVQKHEPPPSPPPTYIVELTQDELDLITTALGVSSTYALVPSGSCRGRDIERRRDLVHEIYNALRAGGGQQLISTPAYARIYVREHA